MISENKVIINKMSQEGIEITCKHCKKSQTYTMRSKKIPNRPKTACQNCGKCIYIDRTLLVKDDQKDDDQRPNDQKNINKTNKPVEEPKKPEISQQSSLTKTDQMTKTPKENRMHQEVRFYEQMSQEVELFGRTIPLDIVREIARETLLGHRIMIKGVKQYLGVWRKRYHEYKIDKPENFLIDEYEKAQKTLEFLYTIEEKYKELTNAKNGK